MFRALVSIALLSITFACAAKQLTFDWNNPAGLPPGFFTEIQANGISQSTTSKPIQIDVPVAAGELLDAKARNGFSGFAWTISGSPGTTSEIEIDGTIIPLTDTWYTSGVSNTARVRTIPPSGEMCGEPPVQCPPSTWVDIQRPSLSPWVTLAAIFPNDPTNMIVTKQDVSSLAFQDNFNRTDSAGLGSQWVISEGVGLSISSNKAAGISNQSIGNLITGSIPQNQFSEARIINPASNSYFSVLVRASGADSTLKGYYLQVGGASEWYLVRKDNGIESILAQGTQVLNNLDVIRIEVVGNTLAAKINGSTISTVTDSTYQSGNPGLSLYYTSTQSFFDDFSSGIM